MHSLSECRPDVAAILQHEMLPVIKPRGKIAGVGDLGKCLEIGPSVVLDNLIPTLVIGE